MQATSLSGAPDSSVTRILNFCSGAPQETAQSANNNTAVRFTILVFIVTIMARGPQETPLLSLKSMMPISLLPMRVRMEKPGNAHGCRTLPSGFRLRFGSNSTLRSFGFGLK
jgi:hypothetical protein